jgi:hypothetical protein
VVNVLGCGNYWILLLGKICVFLGSSQLSVRLKDALIKRINERRTSLSSLLQYLQKGNQSYEKAAIANAVVQKNGRLNKAVEEPDVESVASDSDESMETMIPSNVKRYGVQHEVLKSSQFQFEGCSDSSASRNGNFLGRWDARHTTSSIIWIHEERETYQRWVWESIFSPRKNRDQVAITSWRQNTECFMFLAITISKRK